MGKVIDIDADRLMERANGQLGFVRFYDEDSAAATNRVHYLTVPKLSLGGRALAYEQALKVIVTDASGEVVSEAVLEVGGFGISKKVTEAGVYTEIVHKAVDPS